MYILYILTIQFYNWIKGYQWARNRLKSPKIALDQYLTSQIIPVRWTHFTVETRRIT